MGREAILRAIRQAADREVEAILAAARLEAQRLENDAQRAADDRVARALADRDPELSAEGARRVNATRLRLLHARAARRATRVGAVFDEAERRLATMAEEDTPRWRAAVRRLASLACAGVGPNGELLPATGGGHARSADGRLEIDASVETRLRRARTSMADAVVELLEG